jgi:hypothetical protein
LKKKQKKYLTEQETTLNIKAQRGTNPNKTRKEENKMLKTYARIKREWDARAYAFGTSWQEVEREGQRYFPSGRKAVVYVQGREIKAEICEIVQVFVK